MGEITHPFPNFMKFGNGWLMTKQIFWWMKLLIHAGIQVNHAGKRGPRTVRSRQFTGSCFYQILAALLVCCIEFCRCPDGILRIRFFSYLRSEILLFVVIFHLFNLSLCYGGYLIKAFLWGFPPAISNKFVMVHSSGGLCVDGQSLRHVSMA